MQQLLLNVRPPAAPSLDQFVVGRNRELMAQLRALLDDSAGERMLYVWGEPGSGKSYLLQAFAAASRARGWRVGAPGDNAHCLIADQADDWDDAQQLKAFAAYNRTRADGGIWLAAGRTPPAELALMPELQTRLGWGLVFQLAHLNDAEKHAALTQHASDLGFALAPPIADYLLRHCARDMGSLLRVLEALDRLSLETRRPITLALLRQLAPDAFSSPAR
jgi:DnaA family protein